MTFNGLGGGGGGGGGYEYFLELHIRLLKSSFDVLFEMIQSQMMQTNACFMSRLWK